MIRCVAQAARFWVFRYGPQDCAATLAAVLGALVFSRLTDTASVIAALCACLEWVVFYGVAFARSRQRLAGAADDTRRTSLARLVREYGVAELIDLVLRPGLMHAGLLAAPAPWLGILLGGLLADAAFYAIAASACGKQPGASRMAE